MTEEDEEFQRLEREAKMRSVLVVLTESKMAYRFFLSHVPRMQSK